MCFSREIGVNKEDFAVKKADRKVWGKCSAEKIWDSQNSWNQLRINFNNRKIPRNTRKWKISKRNFDWKSWENNLRFDKIRGEKEAKTSWDYRF